MFDWSETLQGIILGSFYAGYIISHLPGGLLSERYGGKYTLGIGILSTAVFTILTPLVVSKCNVNPVLLIVSGFIVKFICFFFQVGVIGLILLRMLIGIGEGTTYPALSTLNSNWAPLRERSQIGSFMFSGAQVIIISFLAQ